MRARLSASPKAGLPLTIVVTALLVAVPLFAAVPDGTAASVTARATGTGDPEASAPESSSGGYRCCQGCRRGGGSGEAGGRGGCGRGRRGGQGGSAGTGQGVGRGGGQGGSGCRQGGPGRPEIARVHELLDSREGIQRRVEQIPGGVRTTTTVDDPETLELLRTHVRDMETMIREGGHIRRWDPLYAELLDQRERIRMEVRDIENGVEVTETSDDPWVRDLIRAHATKVVEFVYRGWDAYREPTPMPGRPETELPEGEAESP